MKIMIFGFLFFFIFLGFGFFKKNFFFLGFFLEKKQRKGKNHIYIHIMVYKKGELVCKAHGKTDGSAATSG